MIFIIFGKQGSGKTLYLTRVAVKNYHSRTVYANFSLNIPHRKFDENTILSKEEMIDSIVLIDEAQAFFDCRRSLTLQNFVFNYLLAQARKRNTDFYLATHNIDYLDKRIIFHTNFFVSVSPAIFYKNQIFEVEAEKLLLHNITPKYIIAKVYSSDKKLLKKEIFPASKYFEYYDTKELIIPLWDSEILKQFKNQQKSKTKSKK